MLPTYTLCAAFKSPSYQRSPSHDNTADSPYRVTVFHPTVQQHRNELRQLLSPESLPLSGISLRAVWPLAPAIILCVTCVDTDEKNNLEQGLIRELHHAGAYTVSLSFFDDGRASLYLLLSWDATQWQNIPPALHAVRKVWDAQNLDMLKEGWWEDMVAVVGPERLSLTWGHCNRAAETFAVLIRRLSTKIPFLLHSRVRSVQTGGPLDECRFIFYFTSISVTGLMPLPTENFCYPNKSIYRPYTCQSRSISLICPRQDLAWSDNKSASWPAKCFEVPQG